MRQLNCQLAGEGDDIYLSCCPVCVPCPWHGTVRRVLCCEKWNKYLRWALSSANVLQLRDMYVHAELKWYRAVVSHFSWTGGHSVDSRRNQIYTHIQWPLHGDMVSWLSGPISKYINIINCLSYRVMNDQSSRHTPNEEPTTSYVQNVKCDNRNIHMTA